MRKFLVAMAAVSVSLLGFAGAASAIQISFVPTSPTSVASGGVVTFDVVLDMQGATGDGYQVSGAWSGTASAVVVAAEVLPPGIDFNFVAGVAVVGSGTSAGTMNDWDGGNLFSPPFSGVLTLGSITATITGSGGQSLTFNPVLGAGEGVTLGGAALPGVVLNGATVSIVPEPTTASLLGLGLLGLVVAGRRRS